MQIRDSPRSMAVAPAEGVDMEALKFLLFVGLMLASVMTLIVGLSFWSLMWPAALDPKDPEHGQS